jgi:hypothetical protein
MSTVSVAGSVGVPFVVPFVPATIRRTGGALGTAPGRRGRVS